MPYIFLRSYHELMRENGGVSGMHTEASVKTNPPISCYSHTAQEKNDTPPLVYVVKLYIDFLSPLLVCSLSSSYVNITSIRGPWFSLIFLIFSSKYF